MISQVLMLSGLCFVIALVLFGIYLAIVKDAKKKKWKLILYLLVSGILIGMISGLGFIEFTRLPLWIFLSANVWMLVVGILHTLLFEKIILLESKTFGKILYTLAISIFGYGLVVLSFMLYFKSAFPRFYFIPAFFFITPTFVRIAFINFVKIPLKIYKNWGFPAPGTLPDPTDAEMADPIIINFEIRKQITESRTVFKAKAPKGMELGRLFYFFINDYNSRNPNSPILIEDANKKLFKWSFFQSGNIITGSNHLDPEISISLNRINENSSIKCERVSL